MINRSENITSDKARILMFSQRNIFNYYFTCALYEFEDLICQMDRVELLTPHPSKWFKYGDRIANRLAVNFAVVLNPGIPKIRIKENYDLFFAICQFPKDLINVDTVEGWKDNCRVSICWLNEIYATDVYKDRYFLKILSKFDYVILNCSQSVNAVNDVIGDKSFYSPFGVDAILFCPYPEPPQRLIDVYSVGRRSEETHNSLLRMVKEKRIYYIYDTLDGKKVLNANQHRLLYASTAKRTKYFVVNPGKIDCPEETGGQSEIGFRYFEGAASGTIMIGEYPKNDEFKKNFNWPDVVVHLPFGSDNVEMLIDELGKQPERQDKIRTTNVVQSLMRHDWVYRWEMVLKTAGLAPCPQLLERKRRLENLSKIVDMGLSPSY